MDGGSTKEKNLSGGAPTPEGGAPTPSVAVQIYPILHFKKKKLRRFRRRLEEHLENCCVAIAIIFWIFAICFLRPGGAIFLFFKHGFSFIRTTHYTYHAHTPLGVRGYGVRIDGGGFPFTVSFNTTGPTSGTRPHPENSNTPTPNTQFQYTPRGKNTVKKHAPRGKNTGSHTRTPQNTG